MHRVSPAACELLDAITRRDADRAAPTGRVYPRADTTWLAELLMDLEGEDGEPARSEDGRTEEERPLLPTDR